MGQLQNVSRRSKREHDKNENMTLTDLPIVRRMLRMFGMLGIDRRRQLASTAYCVRSLFDAHLKDERGSQLKISSALYREIEFIE
jgi:hypothetical protein